jgi:hypothetical protein
MMMMNIEGRTNLINFGARAFVDSISMHFYWKSYYPRDVVLRLPVMHASRAVFAVCNS